MDGVHPICTVVVVVVVVVAAAAAAAAVVVVVIQSCGHNSTLVSKQKLVQ